MNTYQSAKAAAWKIYLAETHLAGDNYNLRAIAFANYLRAIQRALEVA